MYNAYSYKTGPFLVLYLFHPRTRLYAECVWTGEMFFEEKKNPPVYVHRKIRNIAHV